MIKKIASEITPMYPKYSKYVTNMLPFRRVKYAVKEKERRGGGWGEKVRGVVVWNGEEKKGEGREE